jgi:hypothetical protein
MRYPKKASFWMRKQDPSFTMGLVIVKTNLPVTHQRYVEASFLFLDMATKARHSPLG